MNINNSNFLVTIILSALFSVFCEDIKSALKIVTRAEWNARKPKAIDNMENPVPFVLIHHSYMPPACNTTSECIKSMQSMQRFHQDVHGWNDIGYSFGVGGDGKAYYGRGWDRVGAHAPKYNNRSIGICVIGDWRYELPPLNQLETVKKLIAFGVEQGHIKEDYHLLGHRQVRATECPGDRLYHEIQTWTHYCLNPDNCTPKRQVINSPVKFRAGALLMLFLRRATIFATGG